MNKDKIILKDKTAIEAESITSIGSITTIVADVAALQTLKDSLTADNISAVEIQNGSEVTVGTYTDMVLITDFTISWVDAGIKVVFGLRNKTGMELFAEQNKADHEVYDGAIADLADTMSAMSEGGAQ